ncbi:MAG: D-2-hydroxyacid dehydrogenase [Sulfitobacter sp.]
MSDAPRILLHNAETTALAHKLHAAAPNATIFECNTYADLPQVIADCRPDIVYSVRFDGTAGFPKDALFATGGPVWIANGGAGTDHFGTWDPSRVTVTNAAGVAADMMAEYVLGGFLHFTLDVPGLQRDKRDKKWAARTVRSLKGRTLLIVGLGHTGCAIAARARAFGMYVIGTRARPRAMPMIDEVWPSEDLQQILPHADFIAVSTPLTPATRGLIGAAQINAMKPGVILADVSRGGIVDQISVIRALKSGQIAGAALDVFEVEPIPENNPLWKLENLIISPHCSSVYDGWEDASFDLFLSNLARWINGGTLVNIVDPGRGY